MSKTNGHGKEHERMPRISLFLATAFCLAAGVGCSNDERITIPSPLPDTLAVSFQEGVSPSSLYDGARDAVIKDGPINDFRNGNFGTMPSDTLGAVGLGAGLYERRLIIKMDMSIITNCSKVIAASLSIRIIPPAPDAISFEAHSVTLPTWKPWIEGTGGVFGGVSWTTIDGTEPWTLEGGDYDAAVLDQETASADSMVTFSLPPLLVRDWIKQPLTNQGVIIKVAAGAGEHSLIVFMRECDRAALRPRLEVTYIKGG